MIWAGGRLQDLSKQLENDIKSLQLQRELSSASAFISHFDDWQQFVGQHPEKAESANALLKETLAASLQKPLGSATASRAASLKGQVGLALQGKGKEIVIACNSASCSRYDKACCLDAGGVHWLTHASSDSTPLACPLSVCRWLHVLMYSLSVSSCTQRFCYASVLHDAKGFQSNNAEAQGALP